MKWFKHMSNMRHDTRIRRLINKYGLRGYGLYVFILESVTEGLETDSPLPELEEMSTDIADIFNDDTIKIEEIILFCLNQNLFEQSEITGRIMCHKIYKFIDQSSTRSKEIREMIKSYKDFHTQPLLSETVTDNPDRSEEKKRKEKNITEKNIKHKYGEYKNILLTDDQYNNLTTKVDNREKWIKKVDEGIELKGYKYKNHYLAILKWYEKEPKEQKSSLAAEAARTRENLEGSL